MSLTLSSDEEVLMGLKHNMKLIPDENNYHRYHLDCAASCEVCPFSVKENCTLISKRVSQEQVDKLHKEYPEYFI